MRIGLVTPGFSANAADWCIPALRHLARQLAIPDHLRVIAVRYPYSAGRYVIDGADVIALGGATRTGRATFRIWQHALATLRAEHRRAPFDVLHAFWATESGLLAAIAGRVLRIPTLVSVAGGELVALPDIGYGDQRLAWERLKIAASLRLASAVSAGSCQLLDVLRRRAVPRPLHHLPLGIDTALFPLQAPPEPRRLIHVGALKPVKDQHLLLHAFARLRQRVPDAMLDIVGDGPLEPALRQWAAQLKIADGICFRGALDHAVLPPAYGRAAALVVSSRHEAQGMVVLEAGACGRPVIGTRVGVVPEFESNAAGHSIRDNHPEDLANALHVALSTPSATARQGGNAYHFVHARLALDPTVHRFRTVYQTLVR